MYVQQLDGLIFKAAQRFEQQAQQPWVTAVEALGKLLLPRCYLSLSLSPSLSLYLSLSLSLSVYC